MSLLLDANNLVELIKKLAIEVMETGQPCDFCYGTFTSDVPLKILVEQKMELSSAQLVLCRNVKDFQITVDLDWLTEEKTEHDHAIKGIKNIIINNA